MERKHAENLLDWNDVKAWVLDNIFMTGADDEKVYRNVGFEFGHGFYDSNFIAYRQTFERVADGTFWALTVNMRMEAVADFVEGDGIVDDLPLRHLVEELLEGWDGSGSVTKHDDYAEFEQVWPTMVEVYRQHDEFTDPSSSHTLWGTSSR